MKAQTFLYLFVFLIIAGCEKDHSRHKIVTFEKTIGSPDNDDLADAQPTSDGGYIILATQYDGQGNHCMWLIKTDALADTQWSRKYYYLTSQGYFVSYGASVKQTSDGGYIIAGYSGIDQARGGDFHLIKTNSTGDTLWSRLYNHDIGDAAKSVVLTPDGGYLIAGSTNEFPGGGGSMTYLIKTNLNGDTLWTKSYPELNYIGQVISTDDGHIIMIGTTDTENYLMEFDESGNINLFKTYSGQFILESIETTADDGYIIAGRALKTFYDVFLMKITQSADTVWSRSYGGSDLDVGSNVIQTCDGGYLITGASYSYGAGQNDVYLIKTNSAGDTLWTRVYGGPNSDGGGRVFQTNGDSYFIVGSTLSFGSGGSDIYLIKIDSQGLVNPDSI